MADVTGYNSVWWPCIPVFNRYPEMVQSAVFWPNQCWRVQESPGWTGQTLTDAQLNNSIIAFNGSRPNLIYGSVPTKYNITINITFWKCPELTALAERIYDVHCSVACLGTPHTIKAISRDSCAPSIPSSSLVDSSEQCLFNRLYRISLETSLSCKNSVV